MSIFAHSVDQFAGQVNLHELAVLVANLIGRPAAMRKITLETVPPKEPVQLTTNPFLLENLIWLCLEFALTATSAGGILTLTPEKTDTGACLHIAGIDRLAEAFPAQLPTGHQEILAALGARLLPDLGSHTLTLHLA